MYVSYAHVSVLVAEALKELRDESRREIAELKARIEALESR